MRRALVVGINAYPTAPLNGCVKDAERIGRLLSKHADGAPNFDVIELLGTSTPSTSPIDKTTLKSAILRLFEQSADVALLYFSGHGMPTAVGGYLVSSDAKKYDEGVAMAEVLAAVNNSPVREAIILLDCCHSGQFGQVPSVAPTDRTMLRDGVCIVVASRPDEAALETKDGGVFTQLVCDALEGGAADPLGRVTAASIYAYVDQSLSAWDQRPLFRASLSEFREVRRVLPMVPPSILRLLPTYFPTPNYEHPLDKSYEPSQEPRNEKNERTFKDFQCLRDAHLLVPVGEEALYYAAMNDKACKLTLRGQFYWKLASANKV